MKSILNIPPREALGGDIFTVKQRRLAIQMPAMWFRTQCRPACSEEYRPDWYIYAGQIVSCRSAKRNEQRNGDYRLPGFDRK
ncbi:MAG TPA: hypothetical protein VH797_01270 [Nitrososphaeraceae archaeon]